MSRLQLLILWVLAIGAGIYYFTSRTGPETTAAKTDLELGATLVPGKTVENIDGFTLNIEGSSVTIKKVNDEWVVAEKENFPANTASITRVLDALRGAKVAQAVLASAEYYDRFQLDPKNEEKTPDTITLLEEGEEDSILYLGKTRETTGGRNKLAGRFVRLSNDESGVYVTQESFGFLGAEPDFWIEKTLNPLEEGTLKMEVTAPNDPVFKSWIVSRQTVQSDYLVEGLTEKEETRINETSTLKQLLSGAAFTGLVSAEDYKKRANEKGTRQLKATVSAGSVCLINITPEKKEAPKKDADRDQPAAPTPAENFFVSIEILSGPTKPGPLAPDADLQTKAIYGERIANLEKVSAKINRKREIYKDRYFSITRAAVSPLLKNRGEFVQVKKAKTKPVSVTTDPIPVPTPGSGNGRSTPGLPGIGPPPESIARPKEDVKKKPKIEAVTPPIQIPPAPKKAEEEKKTDD